jgi:hypothetical protein
VAFVLDVHGDMAPAAQIATGRVEVLGVRIDGINTINDRKPSMTKQKLLASKSAPANQFTKLDAATLNNKAHQPASAAGGVDNAALQPIAEMLTQLSPSNLHLVENIIRVIVDEQSRDSD